MKYVINDFELCIIEDVSVLSEIFDFRAVVCRWVLQG